MSVRHSEENINQKSLGMLGDIGVLSFDFGKTITTGEGGAIITNNKKLFNYSMSYHDHGHENKFLAEETTQLNFLVLIIE